MPPPSQPGERYTIRQKIFSFLGASFQIFDERGEVVAFCRQKAFRLREDIRVYTDETRETELFSMRARSVLDFGATYDVALPEGQVLASIRRKGFTSLVRDSWTIFGPEGEELARLQEDSAGMAFLRRMLPLVAVFSPQRFHLERADEPEGAPLAVFRTHFNLFVYRLGITIEREDEDLDDLVILAMGCLIAAIEGRQGDGDSGAGLFSGG